MFQVNKVPGFHYTGISEVTVPTMTVFSPVDRRTDAAIVVFPGGGFRLLAIDLEGTEICDWITSQGITCVLLKYRVPKSNHYWDREQKRHITPAVPFALQDAQRAIKLVRANAARFNVDPSKIGVLGMSAGAYLVAQTSTISEAAYRPVDAADSQSSVPDFAIALYPGHLCRSGGVLDPSLKLTENTPPTFLLAAWDDPVNKICNTTVYANALANAGARAEVHVFAQGKHAFGLRHQELPIAAWPSLVETWLNAIDVLATPSTMRRDEK
ncbi:xylanase [Lysobacter bugurensis]|uniref:Xylanase n=2 Tax=Cognatilysobacter bugurensis TaxID=543356 RepID=A0A918T268_9GAMM|nr:xylanase [Lysobacter bugurensis]